MLDDNKKYDYHGFRNILNAIPDAHYQKYGVLYIAGVDKLERTYQGFYSWYLNMYANPTLAPIFLEALKNVVQSKNHFFPKLTDWEIRNEVITPSRKRIDLLIKGLGSLRRTNLVVEMKVKASLYNDLDDYWESFGGDNSSGVLLTIDPTVSTNSNFINITHSEWCSEIKKLVRKNKIKLEDLEEFTLNEFLSSIENINSYTRAKMIDFKFLQENKKKIAELISLQENSYAKLQKAVEDFAKMINFETEIIGGRKLDKLFLAQEIYLLKPKSANRVALDFAWILPSESPHIIEVGFNLIRNNTKYHEQIVESTILNQLVRKHNHLKTTTILIEKEYFDVFYAEVKVEDLIDLNDIVKSLLYLYEKEWKGWLQILDEELKKIKSGQTI